MKKLSTKGLVETVLKMADLQVCLYEDIRSVLAMVITGLERPVFQSFINEKRMSSTIVEKMVNW